jgi:hypothetical protein
MTIRDYKRVQVIAPMRLTDIIGEFIAAGCVVALPIILLFIGAALT